VFNENARDGEAVIVKGKKKAGKRTTRGVAENRRAVAARTFNALLEQSFIDRAPEGTPTYLTAAAGPSKASAPRKFCSVCGFQAPYGCARCGMRFCSKKCSAVHAETRCLKMVG
jgi:zinc finger HIT domain-containing protein 1